MSIRRNNLKNNIMKSVEFNGKLSNIRMTGSPKYRSHSSLYFKKGNAIPTHSSQLKKFKHLNVLCQKDVELIDSVFSFSNTGKTAEYIFTKSKTFVRLVNFNEFKEALKLALQNDFKLS